MPHDLSHHVRGRHLGQQHTQPVCRMSWKRDRQAPEKTGLRVETTFIVVLQDDYEGWLLERTFGHGRQSGKTAQAADGPDSPAQIKFVRASNAESG